MKRSSIPGRCPSCKGKLVIVKLECMDCGTEVNGSFNLCPVCTLDESTRNLFDLFMDSRGNLKQVQRNLGVSYPTVRVKIEEMFRKLEPEPSPRDPLDILAQLRDGEISVEEAERLLKKKE